MVVIPAKMGRLNRRALLRRLQRLGTATRADLAKSLGLSQPTTGKIVEDFLAQGVIEEVEELPGSPRSGKPATRLGRPGRILRLNQSDPRFIGIQLGVQETKLAALCLRPEREDQWAVCFETPATTEQWSAELRSAATRLPSAEWWGVLISVPGIVDEPAGRVVFSPNLHWTENVDLASLVQAIWPVPAVLVQEERALALGHRALHPEAEDFLLVDFGDGVGGAAIIGGQPYATSLPLSGELGHAPVLGNARRCGCGAIGCVETLVSLRGLLDSFGSAHPDGSRSWASLADTIADAGVEPWLRHALDASAVVIAGALNVLGLRHVVITGSLTELPATVLEYLARGVVNGAMWARFGAIEVIGAPHHRTAGLVAAGIDRVTLPLSAPDSP